ncbi:hypothetical protein UNSWDHB_12 [Dehalobacter sp. UNSWDHB]|nr:hypothetical protein UNSWDHB_12 [Dehalobacter sp. UNSWDHB]
MELATAKYWVDNFNKNTITYKSKKQVYIQTWHGDRGFKKIAYDSPFFTKKLIESEICDLFISGSEYGERKIRTAFKYSGEIMKTGCPRNDVLVKDNGRVRSLIKQKINLSENTCVLLYAPTLRRDVVEGHKLQSYNDIDLVEVIKTLEKMTKMKWLCLIRAHSAVDGLEGIPSSEIDIIDVTAYEDMSDLLLISDFLITDYSSSAGDFVLLNRPLVLFQPDRENYNKYDRPFYFDMEQSPYMIAKNQENLIEIVLKIDKEKIPRKCREIHDFYGTVETGEASKNVVEYMLSKK